MASSTKTRSGRSAKTSAGSKGSSGGSKRSSGGGSGQRRAAGKASGKRELIDTGTDKRYVRRDGLGQFKESDDVGRSLSMDRKRKAKNASPPGQGDRGDRKR
jgi:hypothetical protein